MMHTAPDLKLSIEGHTDNVGTAAANQKLSETRARTVMDAVIRAGINKSRLSAKGLGQTTPIADNRTEDGRPRTAARNSSSRNSHRRDTHGKCWRSSTATLPERPTLPSATRGVTVPTKEELGLVCDVGFPTPCGRD
jgi:hypothetical protein